MFLNETVAVLSSREVFLGNRGISALNFAEMAALPSGRLGGGEPNQACAVSMPINASFSKMISLVKGFMAYSSAPASSA